MRKTCGSSGISGQGAFFRIELGINASDRIEAFSFETVECLWATTAGRMLGAMVTAVSVTQARLVGEADLLAQLGDVPKAHRQYAIHAIRALRDAIASDPVLLQHAHDPVL